MAPKVARARRYVFAELTPSSVLMADDTLALLAERQIMLYVAVTPANQHRIVEIVRACRRAGVAVGAWPMIDDEVGRWASAWTATEYAPFCRRVLDDLDRADARPDEVLIDLEPPIELVRRALHARLVPPVPPLARARRGRETLASLLDEIDEAGIALSAAVAPWAVGGGGRGWQRLLGTPIDGLPFRRVFIMAYTSLLEGYSRGWLARDDAEALLARWTAETARALGERAAVAVGCIGVGALGDEACYRHPAELARDVGIATASGADHIALFNLGGALDRPPAARWLDALTEPAERTHVSTTVRASLATRALAAGGRVFDWAARLGTGI